MYRILLAASFAFAVLTTGCSQGQGERCEIDGDCDDGLVCAESDTCQPKAQPKPPVDAAVSAPANAAEEASPSATAPDAQD